MFVGHRSCLTEKIKLRQATANGALINDSHSLCDTGAASLLGMIDHPRIDFFGLGTYIPKMHRKSPQQAVAEKCTSREKCPCIVF